MAGGLASEAKSSEAWSALCASKAEELFLEPPADTPNSLWRRDPRIPTEDHGTWVSSCR